MADTRFNTKERENNTKKQTVEYSAETLYAAKIFKQLSPEMRIEILEYLRQHNNTK